MSPDRILNAMEAGPMITMASRLKAAERRALAEYLAGLQIEAYLGQGR
jgi:hypothetical protein